MCPIETVICCGCETGAPGSFSEMPAGLFAGTAPAFARKSTARYEACRAGTGTGFDGPGCVGAGLASTDRSASGDGDGGPGRSGATACGADTAGSRTRVSAKMLWMFERSCCKGVAPAPRRVSERCGAPRSPSHRSAAKLRAAQHFRSSVSASPAAVPADRQPLADSPQRAVRLRRAAGPPSRSPQDCARNSPAPPASLAERSMAWRHTADSPAACSVDSAAASGLRVLSTIRSRSVRHESSISR